MRAKAKFSLLCLFVVCCLLSIGMLIMPTASSEGAVPSLLNYQGVLKDSSGVPYDGNATMVFSIWDDSANGSMCWEETQAVVSVSHGLFHVLLGSSTPIPNSCFNQSNAWLDIIANGNELSPRRRIVSVAYAFHSEFADTAEYAVFAPPDDDWDIDTAGFNIYRLTGGVGIGTPSPGNLLDISTNTAAHTNLLRLSNLQTPGYRAGIEFYVGSAGGGVASTIEGSDYLIFKTAGPSALNEAMRISSNGDVGIGTTEPDEKLEVNGNAHITGDLTVDGSINPSSLRVYDSGWFPVSNNTTYTKTHNLGTTKVLTSIYVSDHSDGSGACLFLGINFFDQGSGEYRQTQMVTLSPTQIQIRTADRLTVHKDINGNTINLSSGYCRIILLALE